MMCSETSPPRLSFLMILVKAEVLPKRDSSLLDLNCDFEFSISRSFRQDEPSSADELFSHGVIKPMQPRDRSSLRKHPKARQLILFLLFQSCVKYVPSPYISRGTSKLFCLSSFLIPWEGEKAKK
ncbi:hypothetical protein M0R45_023562 [Rubus argutus]|uniref:Uncharacterized protein n=1 Tax=Rubus argutus TaxID=59490 RepID=A0AAW1WSN4_RUBAR